MNKPPHCSVVSSLSANSLSSCVYTIILRLCKSENFQLRCCIKFCRTLYNTQGIKDNCFLKLMINEKHTLNWALRALLAAKSSLHVVWLRLMSLPNVGFTFLAVFWSPVPCSNLNMASSNSRLDVSLSSGTTCSFCVGSHRFSCRLAPLTIR